MGQIICHHEGKYNLFSTISDSFIFDEALTLKDLENYIHEEKGNEGLQDLPARLKRTERKGTSAYGTENLKGLLCCNRAGVNETHLKYQDCLKRFLGKRGQKDDSP